MHKLSKNLHKKRLGGYSIVELLIVIAIIGILVTLMYGVIARGKRSARDAVRVDALTTFEAALNAYYSQYGVYPCGDSNITGADKEHAINHDPSNPMAGSADSPGSCPLSDPNPDVEKLQGGFLNGVGSNTVANCVGTTESKKIGLYGDGFITNRCIRDPKQGQAGHTYGYFVDENRQNYLLFTYLEEYKELMENDGGHCDDAYEVGPLKSDQPGGANPWWVGPDNNHFCPGSPDPAGWYP